MNQDTDRRSRITRYLARHGVYARVTGNAGIVRLEGKVDSAAMKRAATDLVFHVDPSVQVDNQLDVLTEAR